MSQVDMVVRLVVLAVRCLLEQATGAARAAFGKVIRKVAGLLIIGLALAAAAQVGILARVALVAITIKTVLAVVAVRRVAAQVVRKLRMRRVAVAHTLNIFLARVALVVV
jgi:hypothetical protein